MPRISIVIPVFNEERNVERLCREIRESLHSRISYEIIFVDDGSTDGTADTIRSMMNDHSVRLIQHARRSGQSAAVRTGVRTARAAWVATLDGDGQNDPNDIPGLFLEATSAPSSVRLAMGSREQRHDGLVKRLSSRIANRVRASVLGDDCSDSGCGIKVFDREAFLELPWFDHMHRFLPALFGAAGYEVVYRNVNHRPRVHGASKYGTWDRLWVGIVDLLGVIWLKRRAKPMTGFVEEEGERSS